MEHAARRARGASYTDPAVASFLVRWAVRSPTDRVLDPCFGDGVFLLAASVRLAALGSQPSSRIIGIEIDPKVHRSTSHLFTLSGALTCDAMLRGDFFAMDAAQIGRFDAVVGNPPFARHKRLGALKRPLALEKASEAGADLRGSTRAWAPFIAHATTLLEAEGRLAMVVPAELCRAGYDRSILQLLKRRFGDVRILAFARRPHLEVGEDTVLLLADGCGAEGGKVRLVSLPDMSALLRDDPARLAGTEIDPDNVERGPLHLIADKPGHPS